MESVWEVDVVILAARLIVVTKLTVLRALRRGFKQEDLSSVIPANMQMILMAEYYKCYFCYICVSYIFYSS